MRIFIDTNIILEYLLNREESENVDVILSWAEDNNCELVISAGAAYTLTYSIDRYLCKQKLVYNPERTQILREIMQHIFGRYIVCGMESSDFYNAVNNSSFIDLEDSYQWEVAKLANCDVLLTLNIKDYKDASCESGLNVIEPKEFISQYV